MRYIYTLLFIMIFGTQSLNANYAQDTLLETCGVLSAQGIYVTYYAIGSLADGYASGAYDDETATQILNEYIALTQLVNKQLNSLLRSEILSGSDIGAIVDLNNIYELLIAEAGAFSDFIRTKDESYIYVYDSNRTKAWNKIEELMGPE